MEFYILIGMAFFLSFAILVYSLELKKSREANERYMSIDQNVHKDYHSLSNTVVGLKQQLERAIAAQKENDAKEHRFRMALEEVVNKHSIEFRDVRSKVETAEFMAHSAKMDAGRPLKMLHYIYQREVPPKKENDERRKRYESLKKQMEKFE